MQPWRERISGNREIARARYAEKLAKRRLHRTERVQHVEIGVGDDIGGDGEREQERPLRDPLAGKAEHGHEPGGAHPDRGHQRADPREEEHGRPHGVRQHVGDEIRPDLAGAAQREVDDASDRQQSEPDDQRRQSEPRPIRRSPKCVVTTPPDGRTGRRH